MDCYIIAGGKSRRFGQDKTLFPLFGKPLISHVVERSKLVCNSLSILCKDKNKYTFLEDVNILEDEEEDQFALAGVYSALKKTTNNKALILAADMPFLKPRVLLNLYENSQSPITIYKVNQKLYPFPGVYYREVLEPLESYIKEGRKKVMDFLQEVGFKFIHIDTPNEKLNFLNINTMEDVELIRRCCMEKVLLVKGMTCQHCVNTVKRALLELEGISHVEVDLQKGEVKVFTESDVPFEAMKESIERWGYSVVGEV